MNRLYFTLAFCWSPLFSYAQLFISGRVMEDVTQKAIAYASISIRENTGTASDDEGRFRIPIEANAGQGKISISCLGYYSRHFDADSLLKSGKVEHMVYLKPFTYQLKEITIEAKKIRQKKLYWRQLKRSH